jgi:hypothetical protein
LSVKKVGRFLLRFWVVFISMWLLSRDGATPWTWVPYHLLVCKPLYRVRQECIQLHCQPLPQEYISELKGLICINSFSHD